MLHSWKKQNQLTNDGEKEHYGAFDDLQAALQSPAGQPAGADVLVPAGGVPERVLARPPDPRHKEEASGERMALEASHDSTYPWGTTKLLVVMEKKRAVIPAHDGNVFVFASFCYK